VPDDQLANIAAKLEHLDRFLRERLGDDQESRGTIRLRTGFLEFDLAILPTLQELEDEYIRHTLQYCAGNKTRAATILGIDPSTLHRKSARLA
jgi:DNA-binding NtrC family response regulator